MGQLAYRLKNLFFLQINTPGKATFILSEKMINCRGRGIIAITDHMQSAAHITKDILHTPESIPGFV